MIRGHRVGMRLGIADLKAERELVVIPALNPWEEVIVFDRVAGSACKVAPDGRTPAA